MQIDFFFLEYNKDCSVHNFKHIFSIFKQYYIHFYTFFHSYIFKKKKLKTDVEMPYQTAHDAKNFIA